MGVNLVFVNDSCHTAEEFLSDFHKRKPLKLITRCIIQPMPQPCLQCEDEHLDCLSSEQQWGTSRKDKGGWWKHHSYWCFWGWGGSRASGVTFVIPPSSLWGRLLIAGITPLIGSCKRKCCCCIRLKSSCHWIQLGLAGLFWRSAQVVC